MLKGQHYPLFIFCRENAVVLVVDNEWKARRMGQHIRHWCARRTNETKTQVGGRVENEDSPSSADLHELVPPAFSGPIPPYDAAKSILLEGSRSRKIEYGEKSIIVEVVDGSAG
jgi:hypothetical protein